MNDRQFYALLSKNHICPAKLIDLTDSEKDKLCEGWLEHTKINDEQLYYTLTGAAAWDVDILPYKDPAKYIEEMKNSIYDHVECYLDEAMERILNDEDAA